MGNKKQTTQKVAKIASEVLRSTTATKKCKTLAGTALSQARKSK